MGTKKNKGMGTKKIITLTFECAHLEIVETPIGGLLSELSKTISG